jgi:restriction system protein
MKNYYRVMMGRKSVFLQDCLKDNYIGVNFEINQDLTHQLPDEWREFNKKFIPIYLENHPNKSKVAAGLACGAIHTVCKGIQEGDIVITPDGDGNYHVCEVTGPYIYKPDRVLLHCRPVHWFEQTIQRSMMTDELQHSAGSIGTVSNISAYADELERLIGGIAPPVIFTTDDTIENLATFALEKHLEDFLVANWGNTALGKKFYIFEDEGERVGQQYPTDTGNIDILAISKDKATLLVVELKRGRASDVVVGQILRYIGYVKDELAEPNQNVKGVIIAMEDDQRLKRALSAVPSIDFYRYEVTFKLKKDG